MKESAGQPVQPPLRTWRPMAAWSAGIPPELLKEPAEQAHM